MATLDVGQFELDGYRFGSVSDGVTVLTSGWTPGGYEVRSQDVDNPQGDSTSFGRDFLSPGTMQFSLLARDDVDVRPVVANLAKAWRADAVRATPGAVSVMRFNMDGEDYRVYGRPRNFAVEGDDVYDTQGKVITADFRLSDPVAYVDDAQELNLNLINTPGAGTGLTLPAMLPWHLVADTSTRDGIVTVGGDYAVPFTVTFTGPVVGTATALKLVGPGWALALSGQILAGAELTLDMRTHSAYWANGASAYDALTPATSLSVTLPPGPTEVSFEASDPTNTATAVIKWREATVIL